MYIDISRKDAKKIKVRTLISIIAIIVCAVIIHPTPGDSAEESEFSYLYAIRGGILVHDIGILGSSKENGVDFNLEVILKSPELLKCIWAPHPHLGIAIHSQGETHQIYSGLTWEEQFCNNFFINLGLGLTLHSGNLKCSHGCHDKELGSALLFREALEAGYQISRHHTLSLIFFHISNARLYSENDGMNHLGVRYGYSF